MTIVNQTILTPREGPEHFATKTLVGVIADSLYAEWSKPAKLQVFTWYERPFEGILTERGLRQFRGDVMVYFFKWPTALPVKGLHRHMLLNSDSLIKMANIEIDGYKKGQGHVSKIEKGKNKFRDYCLDEYFKCPVLRIPSIERNSNWIETQLEKFYFDKVMQK
jgi:hypothetical protein